MCIFEKDNRLRKVLLDLKENGVAIIKNYYSDNEIDGIKNECSNLLDKIPLDQAKILSILKLPQLILIKKPLLRKTQNLLKLKALIF